MNMRPGVRALFFAGAWLVFITCLHLWCSGMRPFSMGGPDSDGHFRVGFLPITCHLLCPVTQARLRHTAKEFQAVKFSSWPDMIDAVRSSEIDMAFILAPVAIALSEQGVHVKIVLLGHRDGTALVVSRDSAVGTVADLAGKRIAIPIRFSTQNMELLQLCSLAGINPADMEIMELPPPDMPAALESGGIDAYIVGEPYAAQSELAGTGRVLAQMSDVAPGFISSVLIVRESVIRAEPAEVRALVREFESSAAWIEENRHRAAEIGAQAYGLPEKLLDYVLTSSNDRVSYSDVIPDPEEIDAIGRSMVRLGLMYHVPSGQDMVDLSWR